MKEIDGMLKKIGKVIVLLTVYWGICILFLGGAERWVGNKIKVETEIYQINFGLSGVEMFSILLIVIWLFSVWFPNYFEDDPGKIYRLKVKNAITIGSILLISGISILYAQWYEVLTLDGVTTKRFFKEKHYDWEDVSYYTIGRKSRGLSMKLFMSDGKRVEVFGNEWSNISVSEGYIQKFPENMYDYALWLDKILEEHGTELRIKNMEKLEKDLKGMDSHQRKVGQEIIRE